MKDFTYLIEFSNIVERISIKAIAKAVKEIKEGYYVTCVSDLRRKEIISADTTASAEKGSHWLVVPEKATANIDTKIRDVKEYTLVYARKQIEPSLVFKEGFFEDGYITISGKTLKKCFKKGYLNKRQRKEAKRMFRVSHDRAGMLGSAYCARSIEDNEPIESANTPEELFDKLIKSKNKYRYFTYTNNEGKKRV